MQTHIRSFQSRDIEEVVDIYIACFAEAPWYEIFDTEEVRREFLDLAQKSGTIFLVAENDDREICAASLGFSLAEKPELQALIPPVWGEAFYQSEIFTRADRRQRGMARNLVKVSLDQAKKMGYLTCVVRTSVDQPIIQHIYTSLGYSILVHQDVVSTKVIGGIQCERPDHRIILGGHIS